MPTEAHVNFQTWLEALKKIFFEYTSFKLSEKALENLGKQDIPNEILAQLDVLKEREPLNEQEFLNALEEQIGQEQFEKYEKLIWHHAKATFKPFDLCIELDKQDNITLSENLKSRYSGLSNDEKKQVHLDLWEMTRVDKLLPEKEEEFYGKMAERYKKYYAWEEDEGPGWIW